MATSPARRYRSYLVRCWHALEASETRYVVETVSERPHTWRFGTIEELLAFLRDELGEQPSQPSEPQDSNDKEQP